MDKMDVTQYKMESKQQEMTKILVNIAEIKKDVSYFRRSTCKDIKHLVKLVEGNGKKGLLERVDLMEKKWWYVSGVIGTIIIILQFVSMVV